MLKAMHGAAWTHILLKQYLMRKSPKFAKSFKLYAFGHFAKKALTF